MTRLIPRQRAKLTAGFLATDADDYPRQNVLPLRNAAKGDEAAVFHRLNASLPH